MLVMVCCNEKKTASQTKQLKYTVWVVKKHTYTVVFVSLFVQPDF